MTVSVTAKTRTLSNGTANDAVPVENNFVELYNNDAALATGVNGVLGTDSVKGAIDGKFLIVRNSFAGSPASGEHCGLEVERGSSTNVVIRYNETNDWWEMTHDGTNYYPINLVASSDPSSPANGYIWYNSTSNQLKARVGGVTYPIATGNGTGFPKWYHGSAPPIYSTANTFTVAYIAERSDGNDLDIVKNTGTTVDISTTGINGVAQSGNLVGTVSTTSGSATISGSGTKFLTDFVAGDVIAMPSVGYTFRVVSIASDTSMTVHANAPATQSGLSYKRGGESSSTWYYLYAVSDFSTHGLLLSTRNVAGNVNLVDLPFTPSSTLTGTVATANGNNVITGTGTTFLTDYEIGDIINITDGNQLAISEITSNTSMVATTNATVTVSGKSHTRTRARFRQLPFAVINNTSSNIIPFYVADGWPKRPLILYNVEMSYTDSGGAFQTGPTNILNAGTAAAYTNLSLTSFVPPISKMAYLAATIGLSSAYFNVRPAGQSHNGIAVSAENLTMHFYIGTNASQAIEYRRTNTGGGGNLNLDVYGYVVTEVS